MTFIAPYCSGSRSYCSCLTFYKPYYMMEVSAAILFRSQTQKLNLTNRKQSNLIGWRQTLTSSPTNHILFLLVGAKKIGEWKRVEISCTEQLIGVNLQDVEIPGKFLLSVEEAEERNGKSEKFSISKNLPVLVFSAGFCYFLGQSQICYVPTCCCLISKFPYFQIAKDCLSRYANNPLLRRA